MDFCTLGIRERLSIKIIKSYDHLLGGHKFCYKTHNALIPEN
jgi:hypothetical protein